MNHPLATREDFDHAMETRNAYGDWACIRDGEGEGHTMTIETLGLAAEYASGYELAIIQAEMAELTDAMLVCNTCDVEPMQPDSRAGQCVACERAARAAS